MKKAALVTIPVAVSLVLTGCGFNDDDDGGESTVYKEQQHVDAKPVQVDRTNEYTEVCINDEREVLPEDYCDDDERDGHSGGFMVWPMMAGHSSSYSSFSPGTKLPASSYVKTKPKTGKFVKATEFAKKAKTYTAQQKAKNAETKRVNEAKKLETSKLNAARRADAEKAKKAETKKNNSWTGSKSSANNSSTKSGRSSFSSGSRRR